MKKFSEKKAHQKLKEGYEGAEKIMKDEDKMEKFLQKLEKKLKILPVAGNTLAIVPVMISLVKNYIKKEYTEIPLGTIVAVISSLAYVLSAIDAIPDITPILGFTDDAAVVGACLMLANSDIEEYQKWRRENNKILAEEQ